MTSIFISVCPEWVKEYSTSNDERCCLATQMYTQTAMLLIFCHEGCVFLAEKRWIEKCIHQQKVHFFRCAQWNKPFSSLMKSNLTERERNKMLIRHSAAEHFHSTSIHCSLLLKERDSAYISIDFQFALTFRQRWLSSASSYCSRWISVSMHRTTEEEPSLGNR